MADKELFDVRSKFVERVSKETISDLVDGLYQNKVVTGNEKDSILQPYKSRADMARDVIDKVRSKGEASCRLMIQHLLSVDPTLHSCLGLSSSEPSSPEPQSEQEWSTTLVPATDAFWAKKVKESAVYPASKSSLKSRVALLVTNIHFTDERLRRNGAEKDEESMDTLLRALGYDVVKHTDLSAKAIKSAIIEFSKDRRLKETDSVVVVIMSHGHLGTICGVDYTKRPSANQPQREGLFTINDMYRLLGPEKCPALINKPKIIIIQACSGDEQGAVFIDHGDNTVHCDSGGSRDLCQVVCGDDVEEDVYRPVHKEKDFISLLASTPGTVSYRQTTQGSFLIQNIVKVFNTFACQDDVEELFRRVMLCFEELAICNKKQMPTKDRCTLTRRFYFFPGL